MDIKYNIYYSISLSGPWTLANSTPIDHSDNVMEYFIGDLNPKTKYYINIIGGFFNDDNEFIELKSQPIGITNAGAGVVGSTPLAGASSIEVITFGGNRIAEGNISHIFEVTAI